MSVRVGMEELGVGVMNFTACNNRTVSQRLGKLNV